MLNYQAAGTFALPDDAHHFDVAPDGTFVAVGTNAIWIEDRPGSRTFSPATAPSFGLPEFIGISPDGQKAAVGNYGNTKVYVFPFRDNGEPVDEFDVSSYDAEWMDDDFLAVSHQGGIVTGINLSNSSLTPIVTGMPGASAGVTFDQDGNLFTGIGASQTPGAPETGLINAFKNSAWKAVADGSAAGPLDFSSAGVGAANVLSAAFLTFDAEFNLCIGGGGGFGPTGGLDVGYVGVVSHAALREALLTQTPVEPTAGPPMLQQLDPTPASSPSEYWSTNTNRIRREIYLKKFTERDVRIYRQMLDRRVVFLNCQVGDNPGYYKGYTFVGMKLSTPLDLPDPATFTGPVCVQIATGFVQTLGVSKHQVSLNGIKIGEMTDGYFMDKHEKFEFLIDRSTYDQIYAAGNRAEFVVDVDPTPGPGFADDFVVRHVSIMTPR